MPRTTPVTKAWRSLLWLGIIVVVLVLGTGATTWFSTGSWAPKLGLDLQGGTQIILAAQVEGKQSVTQDQLNQAVAIIRQRVDASGTSEAQITTQGDRNIVVSIPGDPDQATLNRIQSSAKLEFRPVLETEAASTSSVGSSSSPTPGTSSSPSPSLNDTPTSSPTNGSDLAWITPALQQQYDDFDCGSLATAQTNVAPADKPLVTCELNPAGNIKYILGPVEVSGDTISNATSGQVTNSQGTTTGQWGVFLTFNSKGAKEFAAVTSRLVDLTGAQNQFAIVLDGKVISAPATNSAITDGRAQITGSFTQESAKELADQLKFGALPIGFTVQSRDKIAATLGTTQLLSGLIAGLIGLGLVFVYSLLQYRLLGFVTIASLLVAGVITYFVIALMSWREDYRLSLAGVAGLIVSIGFTADSFIVYFERIRDELREGRTLVNAVEAGWRRALRTIYAAKAVNLLSAIVLFILAVGNVQGFALTLGITTIIDVAIVVLFTHPVLQLLATTRFFSSGHPLSGLDPTALGAIYRGRAQFRTPVLAGRSAASAREAQRRQTIAERKAAELAESGSVRRGSGGAAGGSSAPSGDKPSTRRPGAGKKDS